jgi:hypothetical protein
MFILDSVIRCGYITAFTYDVNEKVKKETNCKVSVRTINRN